MIVFKLIGSWVQVRQRSAGDLSETESIEIVSLYSVDPQEFDGGEKVGKSIGGLIGLRFSKKVPASAFQSLSNRPASTLFNHQFPEVLSGQTLDNMPNMEKTSSRASIGSLCTLDYEKLRLSGQSFITESLPEFLKQFTSLNHLFTKNGKN